MSPSDFHDWFSFLGLLIREFHRLRNKVQASILALE
jgi:hypothetical protein